MKELPRLIFRQEFDKFQAKMRMMLILLPSDHQYSSFFCIIKQTIFPTKVTRKINTFHPYEIQPTADKRADAQFVENEVVSLFVISKDFANDVDAGPNLSAGVKNSLCHMKGCAMAIIQSHTVEDPRRYTSILQHAVPQIGAVLRFITIP